MNNREQFESAWHKEYPLHSSTAFTRSGFAPERYANTRVQDGWLMWQAARATPADQEPVAMDAMRFACYLIDHCEDAYVSEESVRAWLASAMGNPQYATPQAPQPDSNKD
jgi:hypothetical protein